MKPSPLIAQGSHEREAVFKRDGIIASEIDKSVIFVINGSTSEN